MRTVEVQGVRFNFEFPFEDLKKELRLGLTLEQKKRPFVIFTPNPEQVVQARDNPSFKACLNSSDLNLVDGVGIVWYLKIKRGISVQRISGVDLAWQLLEFLNQEKGRVFLLGGREEVNELAISRLREKFPSLEIKGVGGNKVGAQGKIGEEIVGVINAFRPDLLLVAFGAPKQEFFSCRYRDVLKAKVLMVVGGAFDYWAGKVPRAPGWMQKLGLEWLFRLIIEPWRIKRQVRLVRFVMGRGIDI